jgi:rod shape-determining protein MreD
MRWLTFLILLFFLFALQISHLGALPHGPHGDVPWPAIEYLPLLAVFYALFADDSAAPLAALLCGLAYDLGNKDYAGTNMIPLALSALLLFRIRLVLFRERPLIHALTTLLALLTFALLSTLARRLLGAPLAGKSLWSHFSFLAGNAVYTALFAPAFFWLFFRFEKLLGFSWRGPRRH